MLLTGAHEAICAKRAARFVTRIINRLQISVCKLGSFFEDTFKRGLVQLCKTVGAAAKLFDEWRGLDLPGDDSELPSTDISTKIAMGE